MCRFGRSKSILAQFIAYYINFIRSLHNPNDGTDFPPTSQLVICWHAIPGFFLFERLFLIHFQDFFISKLSSGILRINLAMDNVMKDTIAYALWWERGREITGSDNCVVNGRLLNASESSVCVKCSVMSILFDKCNTSVFLDISKSSGFDWS